MQWEQIIGKEPQIRVLAEQDGVEWAHEAPVYLQKTNELFCCSNRYDLEAIALCLLLEICADSATLCHQDQVLQGDACRTFI